MCQCASIPQWAIYGGIHNRSDHDRSHSLFTEGEARVSSLIIKLSSVSPHVPLVAEVSLVELSNRFLVFDRVIAHGGCAALVEDQHLIILLTDVT